MRYLSTDEARDLGVVLEVNRRGLHPRGLALEGTRAKLDRDEPLHAVFVTAAGITKLHELVDYAAANGLDWPDDHVAALHGLLDQAAAAPGVGIFRIQDHRGDPEGVYYGDLDAIDCRKADLFDELLRMKVADRHEALGFIEQPLPDQIAPNEEAIN